MSKRTPSSLSQPLAARAERPPAASDSSRRHATVWAVAALLALAGCGTADLPGRRHHQRRR